MVRSFVMRCGLALLATFALAATAQAQTPGLSSSGITHFGPADCRANTPVNVIYTYVTPATAPQNQSIQLFATEASSCPAPDTNASSINPPSDAIVLVPANTAPTTTNPVTATMHVSDLAGPGGGCGTNQKAIWSVCFYEFYLPVNTFGTSNWVALQNQFTLTYDAQPPGAATITDVEPGDQQLHITFDPPGDTDIGSYNVFIAPASSVSLGGSSGSSGTTGSTGSSGSTGSTGSNPDGGAQADGGSSGSSGSTGGTTGSSGNGCMSGSNVIELNFAGSSSSITAPGTNQALTNGVEYAVQVQAVDTSQNPGPCSNIGQGTPQAIDDFWRLYGKSGGTDTGGCSSAGGGLALLALLGAALLGVKARGKGRE